MRQSLLNIMRSRLDYIGFSSDRALPDTIDDEYEPVWFEFLKTRACKDLVAEGTNAVHKNYLKAIGFVSYLTSFEGVNYDFSEDATALIKPDFAVTVKRIKEYMRQTQINLHLKPVKMTHDINFTTNEMLNVVRGLHLEGFVWFEPKQKKHNLTDILYGLKGTLYKKHLPDKLRISRLASSQLIESKAPWQSMYKTKDLEISLGRTRGSMMLLKYDYRLDTNLFYGDQFKQVDKSLGDLWSTILKLG